MLIFIAVVLAAIAVFFLTVRSLAALADRPDYDPAFDESDYWALWRRCMVGWLALLAPIICGIWCAVTGAMTVNDVPLHETERKVLVFRLENQQQHIVEDIELYGDILEFNSNVAHARVHDNNLWTNWFVDRSWAAVEPIELPSGWEL